MIGLAQDPTLGLTPGRGFPVGGSGSLIPGPEASMRMTGESTQGCRREGLQPVQVRSTMQYQPTGRLHPGCIQGHEVVRTTVPADVGSDHVP
jgi:hypothetical protein